MKTPRELELEQNEQNEELIKKAIAISELTSQKGWKYLVEICEGVLERERRALAGQPMDASYYKKIGFLQMYKFFLEIPNIIKDRKIREYLLSQGHALGMQTAINSPNLFIEGIMKANKTLQDFFNKDADKKFEAEKNKFHSEVLK